MMLFEDMSFDEKMKHLEKMVICAKEAIDDGYPSFLAEISDWPDYWGPWLIEECKRLNEKLRGS